MKALTLQQKNMAQGEQQQQATCGRSLSSNYVPPSLENKFLGQTSLLKSQACSPLIKFATQPPSCSSLQPSSLCSTSSSLLSASSLSPSLTTSLLSTENKLLTSQSPLFSSSLTSSVSKESLLSTSLPSSVLLNRFALPPSFIPHGLGGEQKRDDGGGEGTEKTLEMMQPSFEDTSMQHSGEDDGFPEEEREVEDAGSTVEVPVLEMESDNQELEQTMTIGWEEFAEIDRENEKTEEELKDKKYHLLNAVCCSLVNKSTSPGQSDWDSETSVWTRIKDLAKDISVYDPQFLLKVAVYTRQELNIRITANFLLALAASQPATKPPVHR
uniref:telomerase protein component 1-like n=1 Tax=Monopterus albus TaxID=43700 RepID=UPI0009B4840C|nr:telomerase protein component 1-like [Monopterus albus]